MIQEGRIVWTQQNSQAKQINNNSKRIREKQRLFPGHTEGT